MKKLKKLMFSSAFVLAVVGAFAVHAIENNAQTRYEKDINGNCVEKTGLYCTGSSALCTNEFLDHGCYFHARMND